MEDLTIDPKEKEKLVSDLHFWLYQLDDFNDIDMLCHLTNMSKDWEDETDRNAEDGKTK
ncbi:MAG TPA: hypothetical protein VFC92_03595 [Bacteroidales bacterium]|nr:hypothetical protein [Bacteroidales bacterium]